jgi:hypothetical protein
MQAGGLKQHPYRQIFEELLYKNTIKVKPKIGDPPGNFLLKALLTSQEILAKI